MVGTILFWLFCFGLTFTLALAVGNVQYASRWGRILVVLAGFVTYWVLGSIGLHESLVFLINH